MRVIAGPLGLNFLEVSVGYSKLADLSIKYFGTASVDV
jgi:hypothetical protein